MVSPNPLSDTGNTIAAATDSGQTHGLRAMFSPDLLSKVRSVISVLIDLGRLIDRALATWHHYGLPVLRHS